MELLVKDLKVGDHVRLEGGVGVITRVCKSGIIQHFADDAYEIEWNDNYGDAGHTVASGLSTVELMQ